MKNRLSIIALLAANSIPLAGVMSTRTFSRLPPSQGAPSVAPL